MTKKTTTIVALAICVISFTACTTYHLSTQSLITQFANAKPESKQNFVIAYPFFIPFELSGNDVHQITCYDNNERENTIDITNHTGIRIYKKDGTKKTFYLQSLYIKDSLITGKVSQIMGIKIKPINLNDVDRIEVQR